MINKEVIANIIEEAIKHNYITQETSSENVDSKCTVSNRPAFKEAIQQYAQTNGLDIKFGGRGEDIGVTLTDTKNNTQIKFSKEFLNKDLIDYKNEGNKAMNLEDVIQSYTDLPDPLKKDTNQILFDDEEIPSATGEWIYGISRWLDPTLKDTNTVHISPILFDGSSDNPSLSFVLGHEMAHCHDYKKIPPKEKESLVQALDNIYNKGIPPKEDEIKLLGKYNKILGTGEYFMRSSNSYADAQMNNRKMIADEYMNGNMGQLVATPEDKMVPDGVYWSLNVMNSSSMYGLATGSVHEDYADACAIITSGHSNPQTTINYCDHQVSYGDWVATHPYQAQYFFKELYGENYTIEELMTWGESNILRVTGVDDSTSLWDGTMYEGLL